MVENLDLLKKAMDASSDFEKTNTELKRQYIVSNIILYNAIVDLIEESRGSFGTGYPFYVLDKDLKGALPVIGEQLRYNDEIAQYVLKDYEKSKEYREWRCASCIRENGAIMPDLKTFCKKCPQIEDVIKPRKIINRLPDLDLWMICENGDEAKEIAKEKMERLLKQYGFSTSDVDPVKTIYEMSEIATELKYGHLPKKKLPIDTHIIDSATVYNLICDIPDVLDNAYRKNIVPYLPIHPESLRKKWQKDDDAYNFVHDYLSSFTEFEIDDKMKKILDETRKYVAKKYSMDQLYKFLIQTGPDSVRRRHETKGLKEAFEDRVESWREL